MGVKVITGPVGYPWTLAEVKQHLRVDHTDDDALITGYLAAATAYAEKFMGRALLTQTLELVVDRFKPQVQIPMPPLQYVVSVYYDDLNGDEQPLSENTDFLVDNVSQPGWVVAVNGIWPDTIDSINSVRIRYVAGYLDTTMSPAAANVPASIKAAILLTIGSFYSNRESVVVGTTAAVVPWSAEQLLRQYRVELALA